jgi:hypothetical protein
LNQPVKVPISQAKKSCTAQLIGGEWRVKASSRDASGWGAVSDTYGAYVFFPDAQRFEHGMTDPDTKQYVLGLGGTFTSKDSDGGCVITMTTNNVDYPEFVWPIRFVGGDEFAVVDPAQANTRFYQRFESNLKKPSPLPVVEKVAENEGFNDENINEGLTTPPKTTKAKSKKSKTK